MMLVDVYNEFANALMHKALRDSCDDFAVTTMDLQLEASLPAAPELRRCAVELLDMTKEALSHLDVDEKITLADVMRTFRIKVDGLEVRQIMDCIASALGVAVRK